MRSDKGEAFVLRRQGKSYREIAEHLGVAKSTLSNWFEGVDFSKAIKDELIKKATKKRARHLSKLNKTRGIALAVQYELAEKEALKELQTFRNIPLFMSALGLYWSGGHVSLKNQLRLTNTDPRMLQVFIAFLERFCGLEPHQLRLALFIYSDLDERKCQRYWARHTDIKRFHKSQVLPGRHKDKRLPYGTATVVVTNSILAHKMQVWIDQLPEMVLNTVPKKKK